MPYPLPPPEPPPIVEIAPESGEQAIVATEATATVRLPGRADIVPIPLPTAPLSPLTQSATLSTPTSQTVRAVSQVNSATDPLNNAADTAQSLSNLPTVGWLNPPTGSTASRTSTQARQPTPPRSRQRPDGATAMVAQSSDTSDLSPSSQDSSPHPGATPESEWSNGAVTQTGELVGPTTPTGVADIPLDLQADSQVFDPQRQIITARGNVRLRVGNAILNAERLWVNLINRFVLAEGNVRFLRGDQLIEGDRLEYNLLQGTGQVDQASGTLFIPTTGDDFANILPRSSSPTDNQTITDRLRSTGPIRNVTSPGGSTFATATLPSDRQESGGVRRYRFLADELTFDANGWTAEEIRLTNDPFSPPELEFRGNSARLVRINDQEDELFVENARLVFDQSFTVPLLRSSVRLQRGAVDDEALNPLPTGIGIDGRERGGLFVESSFTIAAADPWQLEITPQFLVERFLGNSELTSLENFGLIVDLNGQLSPTTDVIATANLSGLDLDNIDNRLRASFRVEQTLGSHRLNLEYSYRDRLYNGSLGFQDVQSSVGAVLESPTFTLGSTGISLAYQLSAQYVTAETDRPNLLALSPTNNLASLSRYQGSVAIGRTFTLWEGATLPATPEAGLRFSPRPVTPYIDLVLGSRATLTYYSSDDTQESLTASIGLQGQFGQFSQDFFDYTQWNITYSKAFVGDGESPFKFDRDVDRNTLSFGIIQQIYGPIRLGFQTSINLDTGANIDTDYILEYSRRAYGFIFRINPSRSSGFVGFRISDFDWQGRSASFGGADIGDVEDGVIRR
jgi:hypothetical protein